MRWTIPILILATTVGAQEQEIDRAEFLRLACQGLEARLKIGDALRREGDLKGALEAYREATRRFQEALDLLASETGGGLVGARRLRGRRDLRAGGGSAHTEQAVALGLKWLAAHQDVDADGRWDAAGFMKHDPEDDRCTGAGNARHDVGVTGLALLAFLGAGYTDRGTPQENPYAANVKKGLQFLLASQGPHGCFGTQDGLHFVYGHAIAALALCEAYATTRDARYKAPAQAGLKFLMRARNPYLAWRYGVRSGENDTSVTGWAVMALAAGRNAGLDVDPDAFAGARQWIDKMTDPKSGRVGYHVRGGAVARPERLIDRFPTEKSEAMTASGIMTRLLGGEQPTAETVARGASLCLRHPPRWDPADGSIDMYYWFWGTMALFRVGGDPWARWNEALKEAVVKHQHLAGSGSRTGSWDPVGPWGAQEGGRVYSTALMTLCMEIYYRYGLVHGAAAGPGRSR